MSYIAIYKNNPTVGGVDGTEVSQNGVWTAPVGGNVNLSDTEGVKQKLAVRLQEGYEIASGGVTISVGTYQNGAFVPGNDYMKLSLTQNGTYSDSITISGVSTVNTIFYMKRTSPGVIGKLLGGLKLECSIQESE